MMRVIDQTTSESQNRGKLVLWWLLAAVPLTAFPAWQIWLAIRNANSPGGLSAEATIVTAALSVVGCVLIIILMPAINQIAANRRLEYFRENFSNLPVVCSSSSSSLKYALRAITRARGELRVQMPLVFEMVASKNGISFWTGFREVHQFYGVPWEDICKIRIVRLTEGAGRYLGIVFDITINGEEFALPVKVENPKLRLVGHESIGNVRNIAHQIARLTEVSAGTR